MKIPNELQEALSLQDYKTHWGYHVASERPEYPKKKRQFLAFLFYKACVQDRELKRMEIINGTN